VEELEQRQQREWDDCSFLQLAGQSFLPLGYKIDRFTYKMCWKTIGFFVNNINENLKLWALAFVLISSVYSAHNIFQIDLPVLRVNNITPKVFTVLPVRNVTFFLWRKQCSGPLSISFLVPPWIRIRNFLYGSRYFHQQAKNL
jgi:hypothetical protein